MPSRPLFIEISPGELVDRITILEIKQARIADPQKRRTIDAELDALQAVYARSVERTLQLDVLTGELRCVNESLWDVEDAIRDCERRGTSGRSSSGSPAAFIAKTTAAAPSSGRSTNSSAPPSAKKSNTPSTLHRPKLPPHPAAAPPDALRPRLPNAAVRACMGHLRSTPPPSVFYTTVFGIFLSLN